MGWTVSFYAESNRAGMLNPTHSFRGAVALVAILNLAYFGVEFTVALAIQSVALFADSIDFLEDTAVNFLIFLALGWSTRKRSIVGMILSAVLLAPGIATLWTAWGKLLSPIPPDPVSLSLTGMGALLVNISCAFVLARHRAAQSSLSKAAYLSARNDAIADIAIVTAGVGTTVTHSIWPDLVVGLGIFVINLDAARQVFVASRAERIKVRT